MVYVFFDKKDVHNKRKSNYHQVLNILWEPENKVKTKSEIKLNLPTK